MGGGGSWPINRGDEAGGGDSTVLKPSGIILRQTPSLNELPVMFQKLLWNSSTQLLGAVLVSARHPPVLDQSSGLLRGRRPHSPQTTEADHVLAYPSVQSAGTPELLVVVVADSGRCDEDVL